MDFCTLCTWFVFVPDVYFLYTQVTPFFLIYFYYLSKKKKNVYKTNQLHHQKNTLVTLVFLSYFRLSLSLALFYFYLLLMSNERVIFFSLSRIMFLICFWTAVYCTIHHQKAHLIMDMHFIAFFVLFSVLNFNYFLWSYMLWFPCSWSSEFCVCFNWIFIVTEKSLLPYHIFLCSTYRHVYNPLLDPLYGELWYCSCSTGKLCYLPLVS